MGPKLHILNFLRWAGFTEMIKAFFLFILFIATFDLAHSPVWSWMIEHRTNNAGGSWRVSRDKSYESWFMSIGQGEKVWVWKVKYWTTKTVIAHFMIPQDKHRLRMFCWRILCQDNPVDGSTAYYRVDDLFSMELWGLQPGLPVTYAGGIYYSLFCSENSIEPADYNQWLLCPVMHVSSNFPKHKGYVQYEVQTNSVYNRDCFNGKKRNKEKKPVFHLCSVKSGHFISLWRFEALDCAFKLPQWHTVMLTWGLQCKITYAWWIWPMDDRLPHAKLFHREPQEARMLHGVPLWENMLQLKLAGVWVTEKKRGKGTWIHMWSSTHVHTICVYTTYTSIYILSYVLVFAKVARARYCIRSTENSRTVLCQQ